MRLQIILITIVSLILIMPMAIFKVESQSKKGHINKVIKLQVETQIQEPIQEQIQEQVEEADWNKIKDSSEIKEIQTYVEKYPNSKYLQEAKQKLNALIEQALLGEDPDLDKKIIGELVHIPAGEFMMGSKAEAYTQPVHKVIISKAFAIGKYEVTQEQWETGTGNNPSNFKGENLPVEQVSWTEARNFLSTLSNKSSKYIYRLPTEAEWEYACRAGTTGDFAGDLNALAWYERNSGNKTHPVGTKQPNAWGLHDMHGNVYEWCSDWYGTYSDKTEQDPKGTVVESFHVNRGGGYYSSAARQRSADRVSNLPNYRNNYLGFRIVRVLK